MEERLSVRGKIAARGGVEDLQGHRVPLQENQISQARRDGSGVIEFCTAPEP